MFLLVSYIIDVFRVPAWPFSFTPFAPDSQEDFSIFFQTSFAVDTAKNGSLTKRCHPSRRGIPVFQDMPVAKTHWVSLPLKRLRRETQRDLAPPNRRQTRQLFNVPR
jgi:hypothetical protein